MTSYFTGSRPGRAVALGLLCACAFVAQAEHLCAQQMIIGDGANGSDTVISDGEPIPTPSNGVIRSMPSDGGMSYDSNHGYGGIPCENGYGGCNSDHGYPCDGGCNGCMPCDNYPPCDPPCDEHHGLSGWIGVQHLHWRLDGNRLPPLVTAGPVNVPQAAQLDQPSTEVLVGRETVNDDWRSGYRFFGGFWFDCSHCYGVGADYFDAGDDDFQSRSPQSPAIIVARPFFNTQTGLDAVQLVSVPNELDGTAVVRSSDDFKGAGITFNHCLARYCDPCLEDNCWGVTMLSGYRFYEYDSNLSITEDLTVLPGTTTLLVPGTTFDLQDSFRADSEFHGVEFGVQGFKKHEWWWVDGMAKIAFGAQRSTVTVDGETFTVVPGGGFNLAQGGLLTSPLTNIGTYDETDFAVIPEIRFGAGAMVTRRSSVRLGYNIIFWGDVAHAASHLPPGLQVDPANIPPIQAGGGFDPVFPGVRGSQLIAHGFDASIQWQW